MEILSFAGYNEDTLVQQTTADYLQINLVWDSVYAYNQQTYEVDGLLYRNSDREVLPNSFILSVCRSNDLQWGLSKEELEAMNILFMEEDQERNISKLMEKLAGGWKHG